MVKYINPHSLYDGRRYGFSHGAATEGAALLFLAGQVGWDAEYNLSPEFRDQVRQAFSNIERVLAHEGLAKADLVRIRTYCVDNDLDKLAAFTEEVARFCEGREPPPNTFIGVQSLALPEILIEIEAVAAYR